MFCLSAQRIDIESYYDGQVYLLPPTNKPPGIQTSFGVILIKLKGKSKTIVAETASDTAKHFQSSRRDSFCRQMGFTEAATDSVYTIYALRNSFDFGNLE